MKEKINDYIKYLDDIFIGKKHVIKLAISAILAKGHLLVEDAPGVGKTTLIKLLAKTLNLPMNRIQLTSDLLPADILGNLIFNRKTNEFEIYKGPIFSNIILADELNRATPKTQSAFLQAMEERVITIDNKELPLEVPFIIFATQNPQQLIGTFPLPESQLDRFLLKISVGYLDKEFEKRLLSEKKREELIKEVEVWFDQKDLITLQEMTKEVVVSEAIYDYVTDILHASRYQTDDFKGKTRAMCFGLSSRAGMALIDAARAWALISGRDYVLPDDIQVIAPYALTHRMFSESGDSFFNLMEMVKKFISNISVK